jgi:hypothetical protein
MDMNETLSDHSLMRCRSQRLFPFFALYLVILFNLAAVCVAQQQPPPPGIVQHSRNIQYDLPSFFEAVHPMVHRLDGRMPLLVWNLPMPGESAMIWSRQSGSLRKAVDELARRGIMPVVLPPGEGALALARTLQEAGQPVYLSIARADQLQKTAWQNCTIWVYQPGENLPRNIPPQRWPCLPANDPALAAQWVQKRVQGLHDAGIKVNGAFFDDEGLPQPWAGLLESQRSTPQCRAQYPPGLLDDPQQFLDYVVDLRAKLIDRAMAGPIHRLFPGAVVGNFGETSWTQPHVGPGGQTYPPLRCGGDIVTPDLYAHVAPVVRSDGLVLSQEKMDQQSLQYLLNKLGAAAPAARAYGQLLVPYISQQVPAEVPFRGPSLTMSDNAWRELQWHVWLRGANGLFLFNPPATNVKSPMSASFRMVENARDIYDHVLAQRKFLDKGEPMTYGVPDLTKGEPLWSGLRLPEQCLVRVFSPTAQTQKVKVQAYEQAQVTLDAPPQGATYVVGRDGSVTRVE